MNILERFKRKLNLHTSLIVQVLCAVMLAGCATTSEFGKDIVVVEYEGKSEIEYGEFPSRAAIASYVEKVKLGNPKGIVLKFFFDLPGNESDNTALAKSFVGANILLQANLSNEPPTSRHLDERFFFRGDLGERRLPLRGDEGWLPLREFANGASRVCFANARSVDMIPMLIEFQGRPVPSLYACVLEELTSSGPMKLEPSKAIFGRYFLDIDGFSESRVALKHLEGGNSITVYELMRNEFDPRIFLGKVVLVTYTGSKSPKVKVEDKTYKVHDVFLSELRALVAALRTLK